MKQLSPELIILKGKEDSFACLNDNEDLHCEDGPALYWGGEYKWYLLNNEYTKEQFEAIINFPFLW
jgi:hypothetical protein